MQRNSFFVVEVLRALAEESGSLGAIGKLPLPRRVVTGGIEKILVRRLQRVPAPAQEFLRLAAVSGRQLDRAALGRAYPQLDALIEHCAAAGVLEVHEQRWHFSHDKLREQLLLGLDEKERCGLHARIAQLLEQVYPGSAVPAAQVAHHHHQAKQLDQAAHFYALAGSVALSRGAPAAAVTALQQALALHPQLAVSQLEQVQVWRCLTQARYSLGELSATDLALHQVCRLAGQPLPATPLKLSQALLRQLAEQLLRGLKLDRLLPLGPADDARALSHEVMLALTVSEIYIWLSRPELVLLCTLWSLNLAAAMGAAAEYTLSRAGLAFLLSLTPFSELGLRYLNRGPLAFGTKGEIDALRSQTLVALHQGRRQEAASSAAQAVAAARAQKDDFALIYSLLQQQLALSELDDFKQGEQISREMERLAMAAQNPRYIIFALTMQAGALLRFGKLAESEAIFERARGLVTPDVGPGPEAVLFGLSAMCALHQGQLLRARALADVAMVGVRRTRWPTLQLRYALIGILNVYLEESLGALPRETAEALAVLRRNARYFVLLRPAAALYQGRYALRCGHWLRAYVQLQRSLRAAEKYNVRFEQASAHYWLGRLAQNPVGALLVRQGAAHHFNAASALFASLDATWEVALARRALLTDAAPTADGGRVARPAEKIITWLGQLHLALRSARSPARG